MKRDNLLQTIPLIVEQFEISFDVKIKNKMETIDGNIINFVASVPNISYWQNVYLNYGGIIKLSSGYTLDVDYVSTSVISNALSLDRWVPVIAEQSLLTSKNSVYKYTVNIDGVIIKEYIVQNPRQAKEVKVYAAYPNYHPAPAEIKNFKITTNGMIYNPIKNTTGKKLKNTANLSFQIILLSEKNN